jgi:hypothetical protein
LSVLICKRNGKFNKISEILKRLCLTKYHLSF